MPLYHMLLQFLLLILQCSTSEYCNCRDRNILKEKKQQLALEAKFSALQSEIFLLLDELKVIEKEMSRYDRKSSLRSCLCSVRFHHLKKYYNDYLKKIDYLNKLCFKAKKKIEKYKLKSHEVKSEFQTESKDQRDNQNCLV
ncbi:hypothetical protein M153_3190009079 [Pseudoloma neurophilia]|uniref:Uncharacterized protein n=1 Tax=Pseudoloma neurophilia TaxID=146866 RepID=A0A0R0LY84_9MICR|nr:hypothetical protein M153_3190009079 [Pseudoloma neurophilia]